MHGSQPRPAHELPDAQAIRDAFRVVYSAGESGVADEDVDHATEILARASELTPDRVNSVFDALAAEEAQHPALSPIHDDWMACAVVASEGVVYTDPVFRIALKSPARQALESALSDQHRASAGRSRRYVTLPFPDGRAPVAVSARAGTTANWPLSAGARAALRAVPSATAIVAFTPSDLSAVHRLLQHGFGLTAAEAALAAAMFDAPTIANAARRLKLSAPTIKDRMRTLYSKTGALSRADLAVRLTEFVAGDYVRAQKRGGVLREAFGLTAAEARVTESIMDGRTVAATAMAHGVSAHTVRAQIDTALSKTGATRGPDLARIAAEACALAAWTSCGEHVRRNQRRLVGATRMVALPGGRRLAAADFGPAKGVPVLYFHPNLCYRLIGRNLERAFADRGMRVISFDRANCGMSDAAPGEHPFDSAARDAEAIMLAFGVSRVRIFSEFGGTAAAIAFAARRPDLVEEAVVLMPRGLQHEGVYPGVVQKFYRQVVSTPGVGSSVWEALRLVGGARFWRWVQTRISQETAIDRVAVTDPEYLEERVGEMNASIMRTAQGLIDWDMAHLSAWPRPAGVGGKRWTIVQTAVSPFRSDEAPEVSWGWLPGARFVSMPEAGRLATFTHAQELAALFCSES